MRFLGPAPNLKPVAVVTVVRAAIWIGYGVAGPRIAGKYKTDVISVWHVVDGDTVKLDDGRTMRLAGIDCPESSRNAKCRRNGDAGCGQEVLLGREVSGIVSRLV